jgi:hypothetical protein
LSTKNNADNILNCGALCFGKNCLFFSSFLENAFFFNLEKKNIFIII